MVGDVDLKTRRLGNRPGVGAVEPPKGQPVPGSGWVALWSRSEAKPRPAGAVSAASSGARFCCLGSNGFLANGRLLKNRFHLSDDADERQILLTLYERHGIDAAEQITGTFAWVLWDDERQRLIAARDRIGVCGLYYYEDPAGILVASRLASLLDRLPATPPLNPRAVAAHINGQVPPAGETFFQDVHALEPGCLLLVDRNGPRVQRYWHIEPKSVLKLRSDEEYAEAFREPFFRILAEYSPGCPAGVTLSGGMDSTAVAAGLRQVDPTVPLSALRWIAPELPEADESRESSLVCAALKMHDVRIPADQLWPLKSADPERPDVSRSSAVSRATPLTGFFVDAWEETFVRTRQHGLRLLFSGMSGDHLFGGNVYAYPDQLMTGRYRELARQLKEHLEQSEMTFWQVLRSMVLGPLVRAYLRPASTEPVAWLAADHRHPLEAENRQEPRLPRMLPGRRQRLRTLRDPILPHMVESLNLHAHRHGIDFRHPLLDHRLFELAATLPTDQTFRAAQRKIIMRNAMRGLLPDEICQRWGKTYPTAIATRGLRHREAAKVWDLMTDMRSAELGFVDPERLQAAYRDYLDGKTESGLFWHTLTLESWLRRFLD